MTRNKQIRAVLLAALMVFSVFAGSIAFTGSAAADASSVSGSVSGDTVTVSATLAGNEDNATAFVDVDGDNAFDASEPHTNNTNLGGATSLSEDVDVSGVSGGNYNVGVVTNITNSSSEATTMSSGTVTIDDSEAPELESAVHYTNANGNDVLELSFSEDMDDSTLSNIQVYQDDEEKTNTIVSSSSEPNPGQVVVQTNDLYTGDLVVNLEGVTDTSSTEIGDGIDDDNNATVTVATVTVTESDSGTTDAYKGEVVALTNGSLNTPVEVESDDGQGDNEGYSFSGSTGKTSEVFTFDTQKRNAGERYNITIASDSDSKVEVKDLNLSVAVDDLNVTNEDIIEGTASARAGNRDVDVNLLDDDGDEEDSIPAELDGQGEYDFEFDTDSLDLDVGDYTIEVVDGPSGVTVESDTITVTKAGEGKTDFNDSVIDDHRGDVVAIPVTLENTDIATVSVGTPEQGYAANVTVEDGNDDGTVTLLWDSSQSTVTNNVHNTVFDVEDGDDDILTGSDGTTEVTVATSELIEEGTYDLEIRTGDAPTDAENVAQLTLNEAGVNNVQTWTAPSSESLSDLDEVNDALDNANLTKDQKIAFKDQVVVQIEAPGLEGTVGAQDDETPQFFAKSNGFNDSYRLTINQSNPGPNRDPKILAVSNASVVADGDNDTYYVVIDSNEIEAYRDSDDNGVVDSGEMTSNNAVDVEDDDEYNVEFKMIEKKEVQNSLALVEDNKSAVTSYSHVEAEHTFDVSDNDEVNVTNAADQVISGSSNVAPGTELALKAESSGDTQPKFLKTATVYVQEDGSFSATFDFSEQSVGDEFEVTADGGVAPDETVDGNVLETVETETTTETGDNNTTTTEVTDTTDVTETTTETTTATNETTTTTEGDTPGFGVVVALVALVAAALLAVRRD
ncbi:PGF-CTERM sorting domain-containing protein [Haloferax mediterranei ATCC 33500]|uniref:PGF-CTERM sorting domain-containing protein n=1 Tax=Haloferax mediterranei (strain ATCC 33500 / DSM 1411 / JCM 8866 / NBRC 14739 / NCIMB 2177 / R-4) TaxID=523841 RepID=I3R7D4_HALMT|nr:BGTF surface domain-containing protein [Haloferax mediterranei]AFK20144.2 hypothetical protein HFX_2459 [Haloferax mediterranei ATCC 33500]AHZ23518.1 hypothetical protein BM92_13090 [Haloferax mediterranei ATCC 33500]ELZ99692.1 hypothetical protein C439_14099 [Haloferax mediterranei ATCC 33500]MDX5987104.1 surface glycoprotein [Haloferax mediterranei ATCC 33500]QCQ76418.1 PGF-CTERM sorting domain-containing protein [Haloferax mediterranei ATCC 33500]